jgi:hypothetical protein
MAQAPRPNPLHGATHVAPSAAPPVAPAPPGAQVNIHGIPPKPNMAPLPEMDEENVNDATMAEMQAGKEALAVYAKRTQAEHDYGKKLIDRLNRPKVTHESEKDEDKE